MVPYRPPLNSHCAGHADKSQSASYILDLREGYDLDRSYKGPPGKVRKSRDLEMRQLFVMYRRREDHRAFQASTVTFPANEKNSPDPNVTGQTLP